jgi:hypothetical protein
MCRERTATSKPGAIQSWTIDQAPEVATDGGMAATVRVRVAIGRSCGQKGHEYAHRNQAQGEGINDADQHGQDGHKKRSCVVNRDLPRYLVTVTRK